MILARNTDTSRIEWIDIAKGFGILMMVWGHTSHNQLTHCFYFFHMPLFVLLSGYVLNVKSTYSSFLFKKIKSLLFPYAMFFIISFFFEWLYEFLFYKGHPIMPAFGYRAVELIWPTFGAGLAGGLWFLIALFWLSVVLGGITRLNCSIWIVFAFSVSLNLVVYVYRPKLPFFVAQGALLSPFFTFGYLIRQIDISRLLDNSRLNAFLLIIFGGILAVSTLCVPRIDYYEISFNGVWGIEMALGLIGSFAVINLCKLLEGHFGTLEYAMIYLGKTSLWILGLHGTFLRYVRVISRYLPDYFQNIFCFGLTISGVIFFAHIVRSLHRTKPHDELLLILGLR